MLVLNAADGLEDIGIQLPIHAIYARTQWAQYAPMRIAPKFGKYTSVSTVWITPCPTISKTSANCAVPAQTNIGTARLEHIATAL